MIRFFDDESSDIPFNTSTRKSLGYNLNIGTIESMNLDSHPDFYKWSKDKFLANEIGSRDFDHIGKDVLQKDVEFCARYAKSKLIHETLVLHFIERNWIIVAPYKVMSSWLTSRLDYYTGEVHRITSFDDEVWANADKIIWYVREPAEKIKSGLVWISNPISSARQPKRDLRKRWFPNMSLEGYAQVWRSELPDGIGFDERHISDHIGEPHIMPLFFWLPLNHSNSNIEIDLTRPTFVSSNYYNAVYTENHPFRWGNQKYNTWEDIFENIEMNFDSVHEYVSMDNVVQWTKENMSELADGTVDKVVNSHKNTSLKDFDVNKIREQIPNQVRLYESLRKNCHWVS